MVKFCKKGLRQKMIIVLVTIILFNFIMPPKRVEAGDFMDSILLEPVTHLFAGIGDIVINGLQFFLLEGSDQSLLWHLMYSKDEAPERLGVSDTSELYNKTIKRDHKASELEDDYSVPVIGYSPQEIFGNKIPALDINFINPSIKYADENGNAEKSEDGTPKTSSAGVLQKVVNKWFVALRNFAVVGLLCVLVFIGVRIIISSSSQDKAKYKTALMDWLVAMAILFCMHLIMSGTLVITESITAAITNDDQGIEIDVDGDKQIVTNLMGLVRFRVQYKELGAKAAYLVLYIMLVIFTVMFTVDYLRRVLMMAFLTIISPVVAMTYPIDKLGDGSAQAFNKWLKEYIFNALLQPFHLLIYTVLLSSAIDLAANNPIYAIVALAFLKPAEKLLRSIFGFDKAGVGTLGTFGALAGGAMTMKGIDMIGKIGAGKGSQGNSKSNAGGSGGNGNPSNIWTQDNISGYLNADKNSIGKSKNVESGNVQNGNAQVENATNGSMPVENATDGSVTDKNTLDPNALVNGNMPVENATDGNMPVENATDGSMPVENATDGNMPVDGNMPAENATDGNETMTNEDKLNEIRFGDRFKNGVRNGVGTLGNAAGRKVGDIQKGLGDFKNRHFTGKNVKKLAKKGVRLAGRTAVRGYGAAALGLVGLAAGATTGDLGTTFKTMGAGALAGKSVGSAASNLAGQVGKAGSEIWAGGKDEQQKKMKRREFIDNNEYRNYFKEKMNVKGKELNNVMQAAADYNDKGITNKEDILRGLQFEGKHNRSREQTINAMNMANKVSNDDLDNEEKRENLTQKMQAALETAGYKGDAEKQANLMVEDIDMIKNGDKIKDRRAEQRERRRQKEEVERTRREEFKKEREANVNNNQNEISNQNDNSQ